MTRLVVTSDGWLQAPTGRYRCAIGKAGVTLDKREGDHTTPIGCFELRRLYYRADRHAAPATGLPISSIAQVDGWCDAPGDSNYNRPVHLPYAASAEQMWRADALYDYVVVIGYNDAPPVAGKGSAIFLHVATPDYAGTEGCVALAMDDLVAVLASLGPGSDILIEAP